MMARACDRRWFALPAVFSLLALFTALDGDLSWLVYLVFLGFLAFLSHHRPRAGARF